MALGERIVFFYNLAIIRQSAQSCKLKGCVYLDEILLERIEDIDLSTVDNNVAQSIREAIKAAKEADLAEDVEDGQYHGEKAHKAIKRAIHQLR